MLRGLHMLFGAVLASLTGCSTPDVSSDSSNQQETSSTASGTASTNTEDTQTSDSDNAQSPFEPDESWKRWELRFDQFELPAEHTVYACQGFSVPTDGLEHIVAFDSKIDQDSLVHHMILSKVAEPFGFDASCYPGPSQTGRVIWGWAPGAEPVVLPDEAGFLVGDSAQTTHYILQIHYNNPLLESGHVDASGVDIYHTEKLRPDDAAVFGLGYVDGLVIPAGLSSWEVVSECSGQSTNALLREPITVFGSWLHAHRLGKALWTDLRRGGAKVGELGRHDPYRFDNQRFETLDVVVEPGDQLETHCVYDSSERTEPTYGGGSTNDEMCLNFLLYYPKQPFGYCHDG